MMHSLADLNNQSHKQFSDSFIDQIQDEDEEIDFDQLLGDAARSQADYDEDRDDSLDEDDMMLTKTADEAAILAKPTPETDKSPLEKAEDKEREMWDYVIEKHGRKEFEAVYNIISKYRN